MQMNTSPSLLAFKEPLSLTKKHHFPSIQCLEELSSPLKRPNEHLLLHWKILKEHFLTPHENLKAIFTFTFTKKKVKTKHSQKYSETKSQKLKIFNHQKDNTDTCPLSSHATWLLQSEPTRPTRQGWYRGGSTWPLCGAEHTCSTPSWEACSPWKSGSPGYLKTCHHLSWYSVSELLTPHNETSRHDQDVQLRLEPWK